MLFLVYLRDYLFHVYTLSSKWIRITVHLIFLSQMAFDDTLSLLIDSLSGTFTSNWGFTSHMFNLPYFFILLDLWSRNPAILSSKSRSLSLVINGTTPSSLHFSASSPFSHCLTPLIDSLFLYQSTSLSSINRTTFSPLSCSFSSFLLSISALSEIAQLPNSS